ncbi:Acyltransferase family protein [Symmachiella macrocystis]|uniref:Acyltransferase family protein n=1 Tax=Symmachiella macrocystis TaxID=2527985 RepID=A0A5C6BPS4_9PLAN|nr:acyltransferase [Symmachiella macrocystis]TWU13401.1 Acyltransferase family protein [Symmachiella macrocystis]
MGLAVANQAKRPNRFYLLDPIRGLAAIWVFLFHYQFSKPFQSTLPTIHSFFKLGDMAVPLFFVISGYCIALAAERTKERLKSPWQFLRSRMRRIYPTFWLSVGIIFILRCVAIALRKDGLTAKVPGLYYPCLPSYDAVDWLGVLTLTRGVTSDQGAWWERFGQVNGAYWTLAIEMQFYITVGILLMLRRFYLVGLVAISALSLLAWLHNPSFVMTAAAGTFLPYWSWFSCGLLLWYIHNLGWTAQQLLGSWDKRICLAMLASISSTLLYFSYSSITPDQLVFSLLSALFLWCLQPFDAWFSKLQSPSKSWTMRLLPGMATALGTASYSIYLLHNEVSMFLSSVLLKQIPIRGILLDSIILAGTISVCYLLFLKIEKPFITTQTSPVILPLESKPKVRPMTFERKSAAA